MKQILIVHYDMALGGAESSLLGLLDTIDYNKYTVDLFLLSHSGEFLPLINENVHLLPEVPCYRALTRSIAENLRSGQIRIALSRGYAKARSAMSHGALHHSHNYKQYFHKLCMPYLPDIPGEYDLAISFNDPHYIIGEKVKADVKLAWFHTDASQVRFCDAIEKEMWGLSDYIVNVSKNCKYAFDQSHPYLDLSRSIVIENILSRTSIITRSLSLDPHDEMMLGKCSTLLSVGRFCDAKNFDNVPDICRRLVADGLDVKWYLIGYGGDEPLIRQRIAEAGMQDRVIILGKKENPYPYIRACDLYVQPSRYEGKAVTVREAQLLGKPVVITDYATSASQLEDGVDGVIVPMDNAGCAAGIAALLRDPERMRQLSENCAKRDYTNCAEIEKIYALMENNERETDELE